MLARRMDELEERIAELEAEEELKAIRPDLDGRQVMDHLGLDSRPRGRPGAGHPARAPPRRGPARRGGGLPPPRRVVGRARRPEAGPKPEQGPSRDPVQRASPPSISAPQPVPQVPASPGRSLIELRCVEMPLWHRAWGCMGHRTHLPLEFLHFVQELRRRRCCGPWWCFASTAHPPAGCGLWSSPPMLQSTVVLRLRTAAARPVHHSALRTRWTSARWWWSSWRVWRAIQSTSRSAGSG